MEHILKREQVQISTLSCIARTSISLFATNLKEGLTNNKVFKQYKHSYLFQVRDFYSSTVKKVGGIVDMKALHNLLQEGNRRQPTEPSKQPIRTRYLDHVTAYQPIKVRYFLILGYLLGDFTRML